MLLYNTVSHFFDASYIELTQTPSDHGYKLVHATVRLFHHTLDSIRHTTTPVRLRYHWSLSFVNLWDCYIAGSHWTTLEAISADSLGIYSPFSIHCTFACHCIAIGSSGILCRTLGSCTASLQYFNSHNPNPYFHSICATSVLLVLLKFASYHIGSDPSIDILCHILNSVDCLYHLAWADIWGHLQQYTRSNNSFHHFSPFLCIKSTNGSKDDLKIGENLMITGDVNQDGSITAKTIQIRPKVNPTQP